MLLNLNINGLPPSVNQLYRKNASGAIYTTPKVIEFKKMVKIELSKFKMKSSNKPIKMIIVFSIKDKRRRDIDNMLKVLLDSMNKIVFEDDSQVIELHVKKNVRVNI